jgi:hypothetical protein
MFRRDKPQEAGVALKFDKRRAYRLAGGSGLVAMALAVLLASAGRADYGPQVTQAPWISGTPNVGQTLSAMGGHWTGPRGTTAGYLWLRCSDGDVRNCRPIDHAASSTYMVQGADQNQMLRVALWAASGRQYDYKVSDAVGPAGQVNAAPPPAATPVPPAPTPVPNNGAVLHQNGVAKKAKMLRPTPVVRIRGRLTRDGANVTLMTVRAPKGAHVSVSCTGSHCPHSALRRGGGLTRYSKLERVWKSGTRLTVRISKPGYVTKISVITIRRGSAPGRVDRCLYPGHKRTQKCP